MSQRPFRPTGPKPLEDRQMNKQSYTKTIDVQARPSTAFEAVTKGVEHWWTRPDQPLVNIGDRAKFTFPPGVSYWTFELSGMKPSTWVEWTCVDALHIHEGKPRCFAHA